MTNFFDMRCPGCGDEDRLDIQATGSPLASNRATLFIETACCGWEG
jgi:hypothetical protein